MEYFTDPHLCLICFGYHPLVYCKYFKTFNVLQRQYLVNVHRYCPKCFSKAHLLSECSLTESCSKCKGPHHTMLHPQREEHHEYNSSRRECGRCEFDHNRRFYNIHRGHDSDGTLNEERFLDARWTSSLNWNCNRKQRSFTETQRQCDNAQYLQQQRCCNRPPSVVMETNRPDQQHINRYSSSDGHPFSEFNFESVNPLSSSKESLYSQRFFARRSQSPSTGSEISDIRDRKETYSSDISEISYTSEEVTDMTINNKRCKSYLKKEQSETKKPAKSKGSKRKLSEDLKSPPKKFLKKTESGPATSSQNRSKAKMPMKDLHQTQNYLQQLLSHLRGPKEYWHTSANLKRQAQLQQELIQLKTHIKQIIQNIQSLTNFHSPKTMTRRQYIFLNTLFQYLLTHFNKSHTLTSRKELKSNIQELKNHLQKDIKGKNKEIKLRFQSFLMELKALEKSCSDFNRESRLDLLKLRLNLRILLRQILKTGLEYLSELLQM